MLRSIAAVLAGYLIFGISAGLLFRVSGRDPRTLPDAGFLVFSAIYGAGFALLGGYVAAAVTPRRRLLHGAILAAIIAAIALASLFAKLRTASVWSEIAVLTVMAPAAALGGWLRARRESG